MKAQKTKAYFKRFQVKFKRRRGIVIYCIVLGLMIQSSFSFGVLCYVSI